MGHGKGIAAHTVCISACGNWAGAVRHNCLLWGLVLDGLALGLGLWGTIKIKRACITYYMVVPGMFTS